ncbi:hypothetical protein EBESD8_8550 [Rhodococcus aetherivorans]|nr:hypothetical protein EBESD8_8550 [Rhodococcus aetherivorans]
MGVLVHGKSAVVTGGAQKIGLAIRKALAQQSANAVLV